MFGVNCQTKIYLLNSTNEMFHTDKTYLCINDDLENNTVHCKYMFVS